MPFVVPGVCRYSINGSYLGNNVANIVDMRIDTTGSAMLRTEAVVEQAEIIVQQWSNEALPFLSAGYSANSVSWVDLDQADGSTGSVNTGGSFTWPDPGALSANRMAGSVAVLVRKLTTSARGQRSGRMYISGITEDQTDTVNGNNLIAGYATNWQNAMNDFLSAINQEGGLGATFDSAMCVVHIETRDAQGNPLTGTSTDVSALSVQSLLATQRRRLRR